ncbi:hypothetical protein WBJ53_25455 [Spirosoma sp. SC4-14]|uniref:hypothetical protein n=1 Tax=Spirosoma sp. SC4-14 TaxID=3128900 RepID=UPI0030CCFEFA
MKEKADVPAQLSEIDLDQPASDTPGDSATLQETRIALGEKGAPKKTTEETNTAQK